MIGLPGDHIQMKDGVLNINGEPVQRERVEDFVTDEDGVAQRVKHYRETLPNGVSYTTLDLTDNGFYDNTQVYTVPPGHYFMMGDNRDNSTDSRVLSQVGYVPFENLIGRAEIIFFSVGDDAPPGSSGAGRGRCAGAGCSRWSMSGRKKAKSQSRAEPPPTTTAAVRRRRRRRPQGAAPQAQRHRARRAHRLSLHRRRAARQRADAHSAPRARATAPAAISGSNSSATTCSAW